jgi:hypothetical protein
LSPGVEIGRSFSLTIRLSRAFFCCDTPTTATPNRTVGTIPAVDAIRLL